jgi:hypothetical protein
MNNAVRAMTVDELQSVSGGDPGELSQMDSMRLQMLMDRRSKFAQSLSNIMKKISDTNGQINGNLK